MSLNFELGGIENYRETGYDRDGVLRPETKSLIFATMVVGIGRITEGNAAEFYARLHAFERLNGTYLTEQGKNVYLTPEDVRRHIGLTTNVANETRAKWLKRVLGGEVDDIVRQYNRALTAVAAN
jgi:hypothetical protein